MRNTLCTTTVRILPLICIVSICSALLACSTTTSYDQVGQKQEQGEEIGSIIGDMLGTYLPVGNSVAGQVLKTHAGTIGGLVGSAIGASLDEEDRQALDKATRASFESGQSKNFTNKRTGVRGSVTVTNSRVQSGQPCRTVKQDVRLKNGTALSENVSACRGPNGWEV
jgi:surface antigen